MNILKKKLWCSNSLVKFQLNVYVKFHWICNQQNERNQKKHNTELQQAQKIRGNSVPGAVFSHTLPKMDFYYSHGFWKIEILNF